MLVRRGLAVAAGAEGADLTEHTILVADAITPAGQVKGSHGVDEAGSQPAQAAVAERRILLPLLHLLQAVPQLLPAAPVSAGACVRDELTPLENDIAQVAPTPSQSCSRHKIN